MFEKLTTINKTTCEEVRAYLDSKYQKSLRRDYSDYARGRKRFWVKLEVPLSLRYPEFKPGIRDQRLWFWICRVWKLAGYDKKPEAALAIYGDVPIKFHPDAPTLHRESLQINLGGTEFIVDESPHWDRKGKIYLPRKPIVHTLDMGEVSKFNCKHVHSTNNPKKDRWSIIVWSLSEQARPFYEKYLESRYDSSKNRK